MLLYIYHWVVFTMLLSCMIYVVFIVHMNGKGLSVKACLGWSIALQAALVLLLVLAYLLFAYIPNLLRGY